jgi:DNA excision repair protein ERCC-2
MGGSFSEGIDLPGRELEGVIIVSLGLPQYSKFREELKKFYEKKFREGFRYAYLYPGLTKILQAAGRLIRSYNDRGIIYVIESRLLRYLAYLPADYQSYYRVIDENQLKYLLTKFWNSKLI